MREFFDIFYPPAIMVFCNIAAMWLLFVPNHAKVGTARRKWGMDLSLFGVLYFIFACCYLLATKA